VFQILHRNTWERKSGILGILGVHKKKDGDIFTLYPSTIHGSFASKN